MKIFYTKIDEILNTKGEKFLLDFNNDKTYTSQKRLYEHCAGRFLVKYVCEEFYDIPDAQIIVKNKKPYLKNNEIYFSISHCQNIVITAFSDCPCSIDLEKIKPVKLAKMSERYHQKFDNLEDFYKFWTTYEAKIKLQAKEFGQFCTIFQNDFMLNALSSKEINPSPQIIEIKLDKK